MNLPLIPHIRVPIAGASACADPWYTWLQAVQQQVAVSVDVDSLVSEIATKLGSPDGSIAGIPTPSEATGNVLGLKSLQSFGTLAEGQVTLTLRGDVNVPGVTEYYGSNATGQRGWHAVSDAMTQGVGLALTVGMDGVTTFDLAELPDTGNGAALVKTTRDAYGRVEGTEAATTDDLTEGARLYFTDERAQAAVVAASITNGDTTHAPSGDAVFDALAGKADDAKLAVVAGLSANQTLANATTTKVALNTESVDTDGCFNTATGRFTPTKAGLYLAIATISFPRVNAADPITAGKRLISYIYKNGASYIAVTAGCNDSSTNIVQAISLVQMNGTTDYLEMYARRDTSIEYEIASVGTQFSAIRIAA